MREKLIKICEEVTIEGNGAVIPEPYIPYIPERWNRVIVLAEAQNLAKSNDDYVGILQKMSKRNRIERLYRAFETENRMRIQPWDDGSLQLAVEGALGIRPQETAVSNSVMWSQRKRNGTNMNPSSKLRRLSTRLWEEMSKEISPRIVVTAGAVARDVIRPVWPGVIQINLRLPSPPAMALLAGKTDESSLCNAHETIDKLMLKYPTWFKKNKRFKALYIWHALDKVKGMKFTDV